jgi:hypothetical protein
MLRIIYKVHESPGRTRLRLPWLRREQPQVEALADALERLPGMQELEIRPYTGSVLCLYEEEALSTEAVVAEVRRVTGVERVLRPGEHLVDEEELREVLQSGTHLAREAARFFKGLNVDVLRVTEGRMDLPTLAALGFLVAGTVEVAVTRKLPMPPWFNLAWWAFRTFTTLEERAIRGTESPIHGPPEVSPEQPEGRRREERPGP